MSFSISELFKKFSMSFDFRLGPAKASNLTHIKWFDAVVHDKTGDGDTLILRQFVRAGERG
jgi:hypothetical protein